MKFNRPEGAGTLLEGVVSVSNGMVLVSVSVDEVSVSVSDDEAETPSLHDI